MAVGNIKLNGLQLDLPAREAESRYSRGNNVRFPRGYAERVKGDSIFMDELTGGGITETAPEWCVNSFDLSANYWITGSPSGLYVSDGATWKNLTPASGFTAATTGNGWTGGVLNGIPFTNNVDSVAGWYWLKDFATPGLFTALANSPNVKAMRPYRNFLIGMDSSNDAGVSFDNTEETVLWSAAALPDNPPPTWIPATTNEAGSFQLGATTGPVIDGVQLRNDFIIGKSDGIHVMTFIGGASIMAQRQLWSKSGILSRNCMTEFEGKVYLLANNDVLITDGTNITSIADNRIRDELFSQLEGDASRSFLAVNPSAREVWVCPVLVGNAKYPEQVYTFDIDSQEWGYRSIYHTDEVSSSGIAFATDGFSSSTVTDSWDGGDAITWDAESGKIWNQASASPQTKNMVWCHPDNDSLGVSGCLMTADQEVDARPSRIQRDGIKLSDGDEVATVRRVWLDTVIPTGGNISIRVGSRYDDSTGYTYAPTVSYGAADRYASVMVKGREFSVIVENSAAELWSLQKIGLEVSQMAGRF